jgi:hypothetical protein
MSNIYTHNVVSIWVRLKVLLLHPCNFSCDLSCNVLLNTSHERLCRVETLFHSSQARCTVLALAPHSNITSIQFEPGVFIKLYQENQHKISSMNKGVFFVLFVDKILAINCTLYPGIQSNL